jgi:hypothetical protein
MFYGQRTRDGDFVENALRHDCGTNFDTCLKSTKYQFLNWQLANVNSICGFEIDRIVIWQHENLFEFNREFFYRILENILIGSVEISMK